jgi:hypothetical protein
MPGLTEKVMFAFEKFDDETGSISSKVGII